MENLKKHSISAISILIAVVFSIISITFAWYTYNRSINGGINRINAAGSAKQTMAIINQEELSSSVTFDVENLMFARPNYEITYGNNVRYLEILSWKVRSMGVESTYTQDVGNFVYNNGLQMAFFNQDGNYENDFNIVCSVEAFYTDDNTRAEDVYYAIGSNINARAPHQNLNFWKLIDKDGRLTYGSNFTVESSGDFRTDYYFKVFVWKDVASEDTERNRPVSLRIDFKFA